MDKEKKISDIDKVYKKMVQTRLNRGLELWPIDDYKDYINMLENENWDTFGRRELEKTDWIKDKYYGRGEVVSGYTARKIISHEESWAAVKALDEIFKYIWTKIGYDNV